MKQTWVGILLFSTLIVALFTVFELRNRPDNQATLKVSRVVRDLENAKRLSDVKNQNRIEHVGRLHDSKQGWLESLIETRYRREDNVRNLAKEKLRKDHADAKHQSEASVKAAELNIKTLEASIADADVKIREYELRLKEIEQKIAKLENVPVFAVNKNQILNQLNSIPEGLKFIPDPAFKIRPDDKDLYFTAVNFPASLNIHLSRVGDVRNVSVVVDLDRFLETSKQEKPLEANLLSNQALLMKSVHSLAEILDASLQQFRSDSDQAIDHCLWHDGKVEIYDGNVAELGVTRTTNEGKTNVHITFRCQSPPNAAENKIEVE